MDASTSHEDAIACAAHLIGHADGLIIAAGAGMGVDSGLPDFRGKEGLWEAYPALASSRIKFQDIANPQAFIRDGRRAWGFYGHRLGLYRQTEPHEGFAVLRRLAQGMKEGAFVVTSNVDGQFQKAGFDPDHVLEVHGSIHRLQCSVVCHSDAWPADTLEPIIDERRCRWLGELPRCHICGAIARPNILMFEDWKWIPDGADKRTRFDQWKRKCLFPVIVELGAGRSIQTIRHFSEAQGAPLIRINPYEAEIPRSVAVGVSIQAKARCALLALDDRLKTRSA